jgi:hypothetical protein
VTSPASFTVGNSTHELLPILGAEWERRDAVRRGEKGSPCPGWMPLTCKNVPRQQLCQVARSVRIEGVRGSNPLSSTEFFQVRWHQ